MDAPVVSRKEIAGERCAGCKEARERKRREDEDKRRKRERAILKVKASARKTTSRSLIGTLLQLEL